MNSTSSPFEFISARPVSFKENHSRFIRKFLLERIWIYLDHFPEAGRRRDLEKHTSISCVFQFRNVSVSTPFFAVIFGYSASAGLNPGAIGPRCGIGSGVRVRC